MTHTFSYENCYWIINTHLEQGGLRHLRSHPPMVHMCWAVYTYTLSCIIVIADDMCQCCAYIQPNHPLYGVMINFFILDSSSHHDLKADTDMFMTLLSSFKLNGGVYFLTPEQYEPFLRFQNKTENPLSILIPCNSIRITVLISSSLLQPYLPCYK